MKRFVALLMAIVLLLTLTACGSEKEKAEKYCWNCGEGITKTVAFCSYCGAAVNDNQSASDETTTTTTTTATSVKTKHTTTIKTHTTTTQKPAITTQKPTTITTTAKPTTITTTAKPTTTTTTAKPTTTTTTATPTPTTTIHTHTYSKYVCSMCGAVDKSHAYEYLVEWVKSNGKNENNNIAYIIQKNSNQKITLSYSIKYNNLFVDNFMNPGTPTEAYSSILLDSYFYGFSFYDDNIYGYINAAAYSQSTPLTYTSADCKTFTEEQMLSVAKTAVDLLIEALLNCLLTNELPITLADLGFKSY